MESTNQQKPLNEILIEAQNAGHYFITIHYTIGKQITHNFVTKNFLVNDLDVCLAKTKNYAQKIQDQSLQEEINNEENPRSEDNNK